VFGLLVLGACRGNEKPAAQAGTQAAPAVAPAPTSPAAGATETTADLAKAASATDGALPSARLLAMAEAPGDAGADVAIRKVQELVQKLPNDADRWVLLGRAWVRKARESTDPGYYLNADAAATLALDAKPEHPLALELRGMVLLNAHRFAEARVLGEDLVRRFPDNPGAHGVLSDALLELGEFDRAADAAQRMVDLKPNLPSYSRAAWFRWVQGDVKAAREVARLAIDSGDTRDPEPLAWMLVQAALMFWHENELDTAAAGCERALKLMPGYAPAQVCMGRVAFARGDGKTAALHLRRAHDQSPLVETAWLLGDALQLAGDVSSAAAAYARVEADGPRNDPRTLSLYLSTRNLRPNEALRLAEEEKRTRGDLFTEEALAWALYRNGRVAEARKAIDQALRHGTREARLLYHGAAIYAAGGNLDGAAAMLREALALQPKFDYWGALDAAELAAKLPKVR